MIFETPAGYLLCSFSSLMTTQTHIFEFRLPIWSSSRKILKANISTNTVLILTQISQYNSITLKNKKNT